MLRNLHFIKTIIITIGIEKHVWKKDAFPQASPAFLCKKWFYCKVDSYFHSKANVSHSQKPENRNVQIS